MNKKDYVLAVVAGIVTAFFLLPVLKNISLNIPYLLIFIAIPLSWFFLIFFSSLLSGYFSFLPQLAKFLITGFLNTSIDFGILNFLSLELGVYSGAKILGINPVSFIFAAINSFFWNKYWTFNKTERPETKEILEFATVVITAVLINTGIMFFASKILINYVSLPEAKILNLVKLFATIISLLWNFIGMKIFVFRKS